MKNKSDHAILVDLGNRLRRARLDQNITQAALSREAGISKPSVERLEAGKSVQLTTLIRVLRALGLTDQLDLLIPEQPPSPMQLLERQGMERQRASSAVREKAPTAWTWGVE